MARLVCALLCNWPRSGCDDFLYQAALPPAPRRSWTGAERWECTCGMAASPPPQWQKRWPRTPRQWSQAWRRRRCRSMRSRRGAAAQAPLQPAAALLTWLSSCCASMLWGQTQRRLAALPRCSHCWRACSGAAAVLRVDIRSCVVLLENKMWQSCQVAFPALLTPGCPAPGCPFSQALRPDPRPTRLCLPLAPAERAGRSGRAAARRGRAAARWGAQALLLLCGILASLPGCDWV